LTNKLTVVKCHRNHTKFLLVEDTGVPGENHQHAASHWQT